MSDNEIIEQILSGNKELYRLLVEKYQNRIFHVCLGYLHNEEDANDIAQDTFINAYRKLDSFKYNAEFSTWIYRIAINLSLNSIRSKKRNIFDFIEDKLDALSNKSGLSRNISSSPEEIIIDSEQKEIIHRAIEKLSDKQKTAFILSKYDELSQKEVAEIMQTSEGAVEQLLQRAKTNLQKELSKIFKKNNICP